MLNFDIWFYIMSIVQNIKKKFPLISNIGTALLVVFMLAMLLNPDVKGWTIQNLMKVGMFQPAISETPTGKLIDLSKYNTPILFRDSARKTVNLADLKGKVVFINFWATWCPPCRAEMKSINNLHAKLKNKNIVFLMVDADSDYPKAKKFMDRKKYSLPIYEPASSMPDFLFSGSLPTTAILDKQGNIVFRQEGAVDFSNPKILDFLTTLSN